MAKCSFDIVSKLDLQEVDNAVNMAVKELQQRFDFKGAKWSIEFQRKEEKILIAADSDFRLEQLVEVLKKNRVVRCLDGIVCNNGKMTYECVWVRMDNGKRACVFGLQIYNWANLGDHVHFPKRGCVGWYQPASGRPTLGTIGTELEFEIANVESLDAFGA